MRRDMNLTRSLILRAANGDRPTRAELEDPVIAEHWRWAHEDGMQSGAFLKGGLLTMEGLEFVRLARDVDKWNNAVKTMRRVGTTGGPWVILKELLERAA